MGTTKKRCFKQLRFEQLEDRRVLSAVTVSNSTDVVNGNTANIPSLISSPGGDGISLREAIVAANNTLGADEITFVSSLSGKTIDLLDASGELYISDAVTIDASMLSQKITIDAGHGTDAMPFDGTGFRVFNINIFAVGSDTKEVKLAGLIITGGDVSNLELGGGVYFAGNDGNYSGETSFILQDSVITNNRAGRKGGGLYIKNSLETPSSSTTVTIEETVVSNNLVESPRDGGATYGAGIYLFLTNARAEFTKLTVAGNVNFGSPDYDDDFGNGGGIYAQVEGESVLTIVDSETRSKHLLGRL